MILVKDKFINVNNIDYIQFYNYGDDIETTINFKERSTSILITTDEIKKYNLKDGNEINYEKCYSFLFKNDFKTY